MYSAGSNYDLKKREYKDYLHDILDAVNDVESFVEGMSFEQFEKDRKTLNAVVRSYRDNRRSSQKYSSCHA